MILWVLYYAQGSLYARGSIISRGILVLFLFLSLYNVYLAHKEYKISHYLKALDILLLMFSIYGFISITNRSTVDYLKMIYLSLLPTYSFFVYSQKGLITERWIRVVFFIIVSVVALQYFSYINYLNETYEDAELSTINVGYDILALIPLVYFFRRRPLIQYILLAIILIYVISTVKRGAIIIGAMCVVYFLYRAFKMDSKRKWSYVIIGIAFVVMSFLFVTQFYNASEYAQIRYNATMEGDSSGRDMIFSAAWSIFTNSDMAKLLFGHGAASTVALMGVAAHNDWLELLVNQGLLGGVIYLYYWIEFSRVYKREKTYEGKSIIGMLIIIYFMSTLFSMSYAAMTFPANISLGYCLARQKTA